MDNRKIPSRRSLPSLGLLHVWLLFVSLLFPSRPMCLVVPRPPFRRVRHPVFFFFSGRLVGPSSPGSAAFCFGALFSGRFDTMSCSLSPMRALTTVILRGETFLFFSAFLLCLFSAGFKEVLSLFPPTGHRVSPAMIFGPLYGTGSFLSVTGPPSSLSGADPCQRLARLTFFSFRRKGFPFPSPGPPRVGFSSNRCRAFFFAGFWAPLGFFFFGPHLSPFAGGGNLQERRDPT